MIPLKRTCPLTSSVAEIFNGLRGEAREKAIATGNYDELVKREPGEDLGEELDDFHPATRG